MYSIIINIIHVCNATSDRTDRKDVDITIAKFMATPYWRDSEVHIQISLLFQTWTPEDPQLPNYV